MDVRDVRDDVRASVRAFALVAVGLCGTCGTGLTYLRGRARSDGPTTDCLHACARAYSCPHVPHVPHNAGGASDSRSSLPARRAARPAPTLARAFSSVTALLKRMEGEAVDGI